MQKERLGLRPRELVAEPAQQAATVRRDQTLQGTRAGRRRFEIQLVMKSLSTGAQLAAVRERRQRADAHRKVSHAAVLPKALERVQETECGLLDRVLYVGMPSPKHGPTGAQEPWSYGHDKGAHGGAVASASRAHETQKGIGLAPPLGFRARLCPEKA